jgi:hypothetical protein
MSFTNKKNKFLEKLNEFTIDDFYIDEGPDFADLFISLLTPDDLETLVLYSYEKKVYNINDIKKNIHNYLNEKAIDISSEHNKIFNEFDHLNKQLEYEFYYDDKLDISKEIQKAKVEEDKKNAEINYKLILEDIRSFVFLSFLITGNYINLNISNNKVYDVLEPVDIKNDFDATLNYLIKRKNIVPKNWRSTINETFNSKIKCISGELKHRQEGKKNKKLFWSMSDLSPLDIQFLLAIKNAVINNQHQIVNDNNIAIYLGGGIMSIFTFRKKSTNLNKYQKNECELFRVEMNKYYAKTNSLFSISGSSNKINVTTPTKYYLLVSDYVVEIDFEPAPLLMDNNQINNVVFNNSSAIKKTLDDQRYQEEMDMWDD